MKDIPNLFIVGAPKCGTTSLFDYLCQHPEIKGSIAKEPFYFGSDINSGKKKRTKEEYLNLFDLSSKSSYYMEGTTWYLFSDSAAKEIYEFNPNAKILIMLRNPVDLLVSLYNFRIFKGSEDASSIEKAILEEANRLKGINLPEKTLLSKKQYSYKQVVKFSEQINRYYDFFPKENIHIILFRDFTKDIDKVLNDIKEFLGLSDNSFQFDTSYIKNKGKDNRSQLVKKLINHPPNLIRQIGRILFSKKIRSKLYKYSISLNSSEKKNTEKKTQQKIQQKLKVLGIIKPDMKTEIPKLEKLILKDLSHWDK